MMKNNCVNKGSKTLHRKNSYNGGGGCLSVALLASLLSLVPTNAQATELTTQRIDDTVVSSNINQVVFENLTTETLHGGAIYNTKDNKNININADFNNNYVVSDDKYTYGGAIYNGNDSFDSDKSEAKASLGDITGNFSGNYTQGKNAYGGAIYNGIIQTTSYSSQNILQQAAQDMLAQANQNSQGVLNLLDGEETSQNNTNTEEENNNTVDNSVITVTAQIENILGNFTENFAQGEYVYGGAIYNNGEIKSITGENSQNYAEGELKASGGALYNTGYISQINSDYKQNTAIGNEAYGGAIYNGGVKYQTSSGQDMLAQANQSNQGVLGLLGMLCMVVEHNISSETNLSDENGATQVNNFAIAQIESITGDFTENFAMGEYAYGGAIYNGGEIHNSSQLTLLSSETTEQQPDTKSNTNPTAISYIGSINGNFSGNTVQAGYAYGGAIYNGGEIINSTGGGSLSLLASETGESNADTSYNIIDPNATSYIGTISGNFKQNNVFGAFAGYGGAIYNGSIKKQAATSTGIDTEENDDSSDYENISYVTRYSTIIGSINADFAENAAQGEFAYGGAIYNSESIKNITGDFYNNFVAGNTTAYGGAIFNSGLIGDLIQYTSEEETYQELTGGIVNSSFIGNHAISASGVAHGGAIYTTTDLTITAKDGYTSVFSGNYTESNGEIDDNAIYVGQEENNNILLQAPPSLLGALNVNHNLEKLSSGYKINRAGNDDVPTLTFKMENGGQILMLDNIDGDYVEGNNEPELSEEIDSEAPIRDTDMAEEMVDYTKARMVVQHNISSTETSSSGGYNVNIIGDNIDNTTFHMMNDIRNAHVTFANTTINTVNSQIHTYDFLNLTIGADTKMHADVDLQNSIMDRFTYKGITPSANDSSVNYSNNNILQQAGTSMLAMDNTEQPTSGYKINRAADDAAGLAISEKMREQITTTQYVHNGNLIVSGMNLISTTEREITEIEFAQKELKDNVTTTITEVYSPIYKYDVKYDNRDDAGYFVFTRGGSDDGNSYDSFNPAVMATAITAQAGAKATINETFKYVFEHADAFSKIPAEERLSEINSNHYAMSTDFNQNLNSLASEFNNTAVWIRPYVTFENMKFKGGPTVDATTYGTLVGFDSDFQQLKHGWTGITTGYIGYNGSQINNTGTDTTMNGGLLGLTQTFYKGNLWSALTLSAGASVGETHTMYGKEDFTTLLGGVGSKTGYNFEFKEGKVIIQPILFMSYTFANTFDYTNAAGVRINSDPMHSLQLNPTIRFVANTKTGWQPYASVGMVWNVMNKTNVCADDIKLPKMNMKPYVEYGLGIQKRFKDKFTAFGQTTLRTGGRNGISLTAGFRWSLGSDGNKEKEHVQKNTNDRTVLKQIKSTQKIATLK